MTVILSRPLRAALDAMLAGFGGVSYLVDEEGIIVAIGGRAWKRSAVAAERADMIDPHQYEGMRLWDVIADEATRRMYKSLHRQVVCDQRASASIRYRCDTPHEERAFALELRPWAHDGEIQGVVYLSHPVEGLPGTDDYEAPLERSDHVAYRHQAQVARRAHREVAPVLFAGLADAFGAHATDEGGAAKESVVLQCGLCMRSATGLPSDATALRWRAWRSGVDGASIPGGPVAHVMCPRCQARAMQAASF